MLIFIDHLRVVIKLQSHVKRVNLPAVIDSQLDYVLHRFLNHDLITVHESDNGVRRGLDISNLLGVYHKTLSVKSGYRNHNKNIKF